MATRKNHGQLTSSARDAQSAKVQQKLSNPQVGQRPGETATVYAPGQAVPTTSNPTRNKPTSLGQVLRIAGGDQGIGRKELKDILETGRKNVSGGQVVKRLDKINTRLAENDLTGINLKSGAANYLTKQAGKQSGYAARESMLSGESQFGTGRLGQALQGMVGSQGQLGEDTKPVVRTILPRGMDLMPSGRQTVRGIGKQYEVPSRLMQPSTAAATGGTTAGGTTATGGTTVPTTTEEAGPAAIEPTTAAAATAMDPFQTALANWTQGFRRKQSSRQKAGRGAQGYGAMTVNAPKTNTLGV